MIDTPRLELRPYGIDDFGPYSAMMADAAAQNLPWSAPLSREDAWNRILRCIGHWQAFGFGLFAIVEKQTGSFIGETGLAHFGRNLGEDFDGFAEATWSVSVKSRGSGYAKEAAEHAVRWYQIGHGDRRTVCMVHPMNAASLRIAAGLGYREFDRRAYKGQSFMMLERSTRT